MSYGEEVRMDKLSEQVRKMVGEWRREVAERNRIGVGPSGGMAFAYQRCADTLESLLPQIQALEAKMLEAYNKGLSDGVATIQSDCSDALKRCNDELASLRKENGNG